MIERIKSIIKTLDVNHWKIIESSTKSKELFFIKKELDMNRSKKVHYYTVTLYKDFEEDNEKYKGSANIRLASTMDDAEMKSILEKAAFAATFVKNKYYPMAQPTNASQPELQSKFSAEDIMPYMVGFKDSIYKNDVEKNGGVNSAEIFINKSKKRLLTSAGIDVSFDQYDGEIELITDWTEGKEAVELYNMIYFSDYCPDLIEEESKLQLQQSKDRALAVKSPDLKGINVILSTDFVKDIMGFYMTHSSSRAVYEKITTAKIGELFQGEAVKGDKINIELDPFMKNSSNSSPYDGDGVALKKVQIFEDGILKKYHGSVQYASYLDIEPTGNISNMNVKAGSTEYESFKKEPYVEILTFSDFQMDDMTGDFGGEIRLAKYFDGEKVIPITGASLSANIFEVQKEFYLTKETTQKGSYIGPKALMFKNGHIAGE